MHYSSFGQSPPPQSKFPPPCDDHEHLRFLLASVGHPPPAKTGDEEADKLALGFTLLEFAVSKGLDPNQVTPQQVCDTLVQESHTKPLNPPPSSGRFPWGPALLIGLAVAAGIAVTVSKRSKR